MKLLRQKLVLKRAKVAEVAVNAILSSMQHKKAEKQACEQYKKDLMAIFEK